MNNILFIISILFLNNLNQILPNNCKNDMTINIDTNCYNEVLLFNGKNYRAGHFAINNKGDMIVEYSDDHSRLFYGYKNNGRYFFNTENHIKEVHIVNNEKSDAYPRYESNNIFVYLENDTEKEKGYLFSTSSYISATELHDLENDNYVVKETKDFMTKRIYGFVFSLLEGKENNKNIYYCIFNNGPTENPDQGNNFSVKKFGLTSFDLNSDSLKSKIINQANIQNIRIVNGFIMEEDNILIVFYMNSDLWYYFNFYDFNLNKLGTKKIIDDKVTDAFYYGIFFKGIYLHKKYAALMYFTKHNNGKTLNFEIIDLIVSEGNYDFTTFMKKNINKYDFSTYISMSEFLKIDNERLIYLSTTTYKNLYILFLDLYNEYTIMKTRLYFLNFPLYELQKELSACIYNNFLVFTSTAYYTNSPDFFSVFLVFGFPVGNDDIIDISPFFFDSYNYNANINLVNVLLEKFKINNNLFNYEKVDKIRLNEIPKQIKFYNESELTPLSNGDILEKNYKLTYDKEIIKYNFYYELGYQYIVKEPNYDEFYKNEVKEINYNDGDFDLNLFKFKEYYGRTNLLKFKLCHSLCDFCLLYGLSNINQQCYSCPDLNDYNYFTNYPLNCLPKGYFQDNEEQKFIKCNNTNSKHYFDIERNKTICFKLDYDCPYGYKHYNTTTNECKQSVIFNSILYDYKNSNYSNNDILGQLIPNFIENYDGKSNIIEGKNNTRFQLTTEENELKSMKGINDNKYNTSILDLAYCKETLRDIYHLDENISLIILKHEKMTSIISEKSIQYEIYNSLTKERLDISVCKNQINILYPLSLDKNEINLYENLNKSGYDIFDINSKFYNDICTPYKTENGTDILLSDRINDIYDDTYECPSNCKYSSFSNNLSYLNCECSIISKNITLEDIGTMVIDSFTNVLKVANYKFLKCYKLVFHKNVITKNLGSIFCLSLLCLYIIFFIFYIVKGMKRLKRDLKKYLNKKNKKNIIHNIKALSNLTMINYKEPKNSLKHKKMKKKFSKNEDSSIITRNKSSNRSLFFLNRKNNENQDKLITLVNKIIKGKRSSTISKTKLKLKYDNLELDNLEYEKALAYDKRSFKQIYIDKLKKQHLIIFTFFAFNDLNLIYIKIAKFSFDICTDLAMNVLFFFDDSMHKIYLNYGKYDFIQQIPQIVYSSIISFIIDFTALFLILTQKQMLEIMKLKESETKENSNKINHLYKIIRIKYIIFFIFSFLFLFFYWYFVSSFCAVYENTQIIFLKDFVTSFALRLIYPFFICLFSASLRKIALNDKKKKRLNIFYIISSL